MAQKQFSTTPVLKSKKRKWHVYLLTVFTSFCLLTTGIVLYIMKVNPEGPGYFMWNRDDVSKEMEEFIVLVAGLDSVEGVHRTDTIIVARISMKDGYINAISIPRDMRVDIPGRRPEKINSAFAFGGKDLLIKCVENFLGVKIDQYVIVSIDAAKKLIDAMGGVDLDVEKRLYYNDNAQNLHINLQKGFQHLDGDKAVQYARFRHDPKGDFGRIERQQKLISALSKKATSVEIITHIPSIVLELAKNKLVDTSFSNKEILMLAKSGEGDKERKIKTYMLPGEPVMINHISYVEPDRQEIPWMVSGILKGGYHPRNEKISIAVKNGCGSPMLAQNFKRRLEYYGFEVTDIANADHFDHQKTEVIVRRQTSFADPIAKLLDAEKVTDIQPDSIVHLEIILGKDKLKPLKGDHVGS